MKRMQKFETATNGGTINAMPDTGSNNVNVNDVAGLFMNGNEANLINYLSKNMNVAAAAAVGFNNLDARH